MIYSLNLRKFGLGSLIWVGIFLGYKKNQMRERFHNSSESPGDDSRHSRFHTLWFHEWFWLCWKNHHLWFSRTSVIITYDSGTIWFAWQNQRVILPMIVKPVKVIYANIHVPYKNRLLNYIERFHKTISCEHTTLKLIYPRIKSIFYNSTRYKSSIHSLRFKVGCSLENVPLKQCFLQN